VTLAPSQYTLWIYDFDAGTLSPVLGASAGTMVVEPVVMQARVPVPAFPPQPAHHLATGHDQCRRGLLDIGSVYDFDGNDTATPSIPVVADPGQAPFYARSARFIRIEKRGNPRQDGAQDQASAFGPAGMGMREILGYAPIEPDGSVQIQCRPMCHSPSRYSIKNARRIGAQHTSWLQVIPGETKQCNGCHLGTAKTSHGRLGLSAAANPGAPTTGSPSRIPPRRCSRIRARPWRRPSRASAVPRAAARPARSG